jgi:hypothetical protein
VVSTLLRCLAISAVATMLVASGCGGDGGTSPITRAEIMDAYSGIDEDLDVLKDVESADPKSALEVVYIPSSNIVTPPFTIELYDDTAAAEARVVAIERARGKDVDVVQHENAVIIFATSIPRADRRRLTRALTSL